MSKASDILSILKSYSYKNTEKGIFVYIDTANGREEVPVKSEIFYSIIADDYQKQSGGKTVCVKTIKDCIFNFSGSIIRNQPKVSTRLRVNMEEDGSVIRIDIGDNKYRYIRITDEGWTIESDGDNYFTHHARQAPMPIPIHGGDITKIFKYCRVSPEMETVFIAYVCSCFIDIIHPCLVIQGKAGSSKSTMSKFLKMIIDPSINNSPCLFPKNEREIKDVYNINYFVAYDNLQKITNRQSDCLCSIVTGTQDIRRKLFTNFETCTSDLRQPIVLNGIKNIIANEDMLERSIILELQPIASTEKKSERKLIFDFQEDLPDILGGIMDILSKTLSTYKADTVPNPPRLIDFYEYGYYICEAWKKGQGEEFCADYVALMNKQLQNFSHRTDFIDLVRVFLEDEDNEFRGTMSELWDELRDYEDLVDFEGLVPGSANRLSRELRQHRSDFEDNGIYIEFSRTPSNLSYVKMGIQSF